GGWTMAIDRREMLAALGGLAAAAAFRRVDAETPSSVSMDMTESQSRQGPGFPRRADFTIAEGYTYISGAFTHPMPIAAAEAYRRLIDRRATIGTPAGTAAPPRVDARAAFASLINAQAS